MKRVALILCTITVATNISFARPQPPPDDKNSANAERAIALAIELEVHSSRLQGRSDVCLGFGHDLKLDESMVFSELDHLGIKLKKNEWCNDGPRGLVVSVLSPIATPTAATFEIILQVIDSRPIKQKGEHIATLLRRGTYVIECEGAKKPELIAYRRTCCPDS